MAFRPNNAKSSFSAFNNTLGNQEDRRNGHVLGRSADSLYSDGNIFAGLTEEDPIDKAISLLHDNDKKEESQNEKETAEYIKEEINNEPEVKEPKEETAVAQEAESLVKPEESSKQEEKEKPKTDKTTGTKEKTKKPAATRAKKEKDAQKEARSIENFYCGEKMFDDITENSYAERKKKVNYLNDLIRKEIELFEKDRDQYISSRRKKLDSLKKADKGERKAIQVHLDESNALFLEDVQYDVRANKSQLFCAIVAIDTDRIEKKRRNEGR